MIVRILGEGQYEVAEDDHNGIRQLESALNEAVESDDDDRFAAALAAVIEEVRRVGTPLAADAFASSDRVLPFSDSTLDETKALLAEPGADDD